MVGMKELNGVRLGLRVRDADGKDLGKVTKLYAWGFEVTRGFPVLFRKDRVVRYDEVRGVREGALVVARSDRDLLELAARRSPGRRPTSRSSSRCRTSRRSRARRSSSTR